MSVLNRAASGTAVAKPNPKEIDWFNFETKMRGVVSELIEPLISREIEDRENIVQMKRVNDNYKTRIEDLEYQVNKTRKKETLFDEIQRKIA